MFAAALIAVSIVNQIHRDTTFIKQISNCSEHFCLIVYFSEHLKFPHREFIMLQKLQFKRDIQKDMESSICLDRFVKAFHPPFHANDWSQSAVFNLPVAATSIVCQLKGFSSL